MIKNLVSVVIPSRNEPFLNKTIRDLLEKAVDDIEIIAVLDGYWPKREEIVENMRVRYIHFGDPRGMRACINAGVSIAHGEYILKTDAHCLFDHGFDLNLKADCDKNMVLIPRRYRLDPDNWKVIDDGRPPIDHMYLAYPDDSSVWGGRGLQGKEWREKNELKEDKPELIDVMTSQGSCWFMHNDYYYWLDLMDEFNYGEFSKEMQEIGLKCWLSGGRMVVTRKTYYAHWHKPKEHGRGYSLNVGEFKKGADYTMQWVNAKPGEKVWRKQIHDFEWLINKFWPIPTWPEGWNAKK